jgi:threonine aldolase
MLELINGFNEGLSRRLRGMHSMRLVDLRSDTVTVPTGEMLDAVSHAKLGDDVYGEDPTVKRLEEMAAERTGKEAALFVASGTMANLVSVMSNAKRGELVFLESESHMYWYEAGGVATIAGLFPWPIKSEFGFLAPDILEAAIRPRNIHFPNASLICVEDTHNRHGGTIVTPEQLKAISYVAQAHGLRVYMDGARIFNAAVALRTDVREFTKHVDNLMFCLSKGLSCPVGSVVVGTQDFIDKARRARKLLGGGMRQAGVIAAPGIVALEKMVDRLEEDHANAKFIARGIAKIDGLKVDLERVQTNMVIVDTSSLEVEDSRFISSLKDECVLASAIAKNKIRLVTHREIGRQEAKDALAAIARVTERLRFVK